MLNKCKCGWDAKHFVDGSHHGVWCGNPDCGSGVYESTYEMAELKWNEQNSGLVTPTEEFEERFATAYGRSIGWFVHIKIHQDEVLREFQDNFGFDLKEVAKEQWAMKQGE
jgi:hypothetical protein